MYECQTEAAFWTCVKYAMSYTWTRIQFNTFNAYDNLKNVPIFFFLTTFIPQ